MGPARGSRKKKRAHKRAEAASMAAANGEGSGDWWDGFSRRIAVERLSLSKEPKLFESVFKISRKTFDYISSLVKEEMMSKTSNFAFTDGKILSIDDQVAVALRRLSSGESLINVGNAFGLNHSTVSQVTWRFVEAMEVKGVHHVRWPTSEESDGIKSKFEKIRGFPNCCGAIDTTHIMMCLPSADPLNAPWIDSEKNHSMVLQAIIDPDMRFRDIVTGWPGSMNDLLLFRTSGFFKMCEKGTRLNGQKKTNLSGAAGVREYILGDAGFPLLPWLVTPYQGKDLADNEVDFNKRHSATRMVAQRALARLKDTWKIIQGEMWRPDKHRLPRIIFVCCLLHNIIIDLEDDVQDEMPLSVHHDVNYKQQFCEAADKDGVALRENLLHYFSKWQKDESETVIALPHPPPRTIPPYSAAGNNNCSHFLLLLHIIIDGLLDGLLNAPSAFGCYDAIFSFGDSVIDTGNLVHLASGPVHPDMLPNGITYFHRPTGRCSDGCLIIDFIAQDLGLPLVPPYFGGNGSKKFEYGANFGAKAMENEFFEREGIEVNWKDYSLARQLHWFKQFLLERPPKLVLIQLGAMTLMVAGLFPFGCTSKIMTMFKTGDENQYDSKTGCIEWVNDFAEHYNDLLKIQLSWLKQLHPHADIFYANYIHLQFRPTCSLKNMVSM